MINPEVMREAERLALELERIGSMEGHYGWADLIATALQAAHDEVNDRTLPEEAMAALGYFLNAQAYRGTFPDNDEDAKQLRKSATWNEITARNLLPQSLHTEAGEAMKRHYRKTPEYAEDMRRIDAALAAASPIRAAKGE